jgi:IS5 family transposase
VIGSATAIRIARWRRRMGFRSLPTQVAADKGYSSSALREWLRNHSMQPVIPRKSNERCPGERFDRRAYRGRAVVEQCVGWLKERRRIGTRFEKLAVSYLAMLHLAMIQRYLRMLF